MIKILHKYGIGLFNKNNDVYNGISNDFTDLQKTIVANRLKTIGNLEEVIYNNYNFKEKIYELKDLKEAGELIASHIKKQSNILLVTDYDSDGVNSAIVLHKSMVDIFKMKYNVNLFTIVNKRKNGNGINNTLLNEILTLNEKHKIGVIITADHGSGNESAFKVIREHNIDVVLTDHHLIPEDNYPISANVFVNPQRTDSYFSKNISGCFVAFLTILSAYDSLNGKIDLDKFNFLLPFVAVTTISDVMSLKDPINRYIMDKGLKELNSLSSPLWRTLHDKLRLANTIDATDIGYKIAPLINTANRTDSEEIAFKLLNSSTVEETLEYFKILSKLSDYRKSVQKELMVAVYEQVKVNKYHNSIVVVLNSELAINGIIAGRIGSEYLKPTVCFIGNKKSDVLAGSARGIIDGLDLYEIFNQIHTEDSTILIKFGGHEQAGGCSIHVDRINDFKKLFDKYVLLKLKDIPKKYDFIDMFINVSDITPDTISELDRMSPYGKNWVQPKFASIVHIKYFRAYGDLIKLDIKVSSSRTIQCVYFNNPLSNVRIDELQQLINNDIPLLIVYNPTISSFGGVTNIQLKIQTIFDITKD